MKWFIQNALFGEELGYDNFLAAIDNAGQRRVIVDSRYWESTIDLKVTGLHPSEILPFGTRSFIAYGIKNNWNVFWNQQFEYESLRNYGENFINYDMTIGPLGELKVPDTGKVFIREAAGFNIIKGKVISGYAWPQWVEGFKKERAEPRDNHDWHPINENSLFAWAPVKNIISEYRVWIINRRVSSISQYVVNGIISYINADDNETIKSYAQKMAEKWDCGMDHYVLDIFETDQGLKVGEINCIHCAGWYAIDSRKVVKDLVAAMTDFNWLKLWRGMKTTAEHPTGTGKTLLARAMAENISTTKNG